MYSVIAIFLSIELWRMYVTRSNLRGYKAAYNITTIGWALLRTIFWVMFVADVVLPPFLFRVLYWMPLTIQYVTFSVLAVFLLNVAFGGPGRQLADIRSATRKMLVAVGALSFVCNVVFAALAAFVNDGFWSRMDLLANAGLTAVLTVVFGALAFKIRTLAPTDLARTVAARPWVVSGVILSIMLAFFSRCIFNLAAFTGYATIDINQDDVETDLEAVAVYTVWEFFPLILLALTLAAAPKSSQLGRAEDVMPTFGVFGAIQALVDDDLRSEAGGSEPPRSELLIDGSEAGDNNTFNDNSSVNGEGSTVEGSSTTSIAASFVNLLGGGEKRSTTNVLRSGPSSGFLRGSVSTNSLKKSGSLTNLNNLLTGGGGSNASGYIPSSMGTGGLGISGGLLARGPFPSPSGPFASPGNAQRRVAPIDDEDNISLTVHLMSSSKR